eukprot:759505-Amphidinium_carterae.1
MLKQWSLPTACEFVHDVDRRLSTAVTQPQRERKLAASSQLKSESERKHSLDLSKFTELSLTVG